jgi:hypothetical protein
LSEIPNEIPNAAPPPTAPRGPLSTIATIALAAVAVLLMIALLLPATRSAREPARRNACSNNLKQIALGILNNEAARGAYPPAYTADADGRRLHSWRTLILPFMEQATLFESIDLTKPWNDPVNAKAREASVTTFTCPSAGLKEGFTTYLAVTGAHCVFDGANSRRIADVRDGRNETILVVDAPPDRAVHWMSPEDASDQELLAFWPESKGQHASVRLAALLDGHVKAIPKDVDADALRAQTTMDGGEAIGE